MKHLSKSNLSYRFFLFMGILLQGYHLASQNVYNNHDMRNSCGSNSCTAENVTLTEFRAVPLIPTGPCVQCMQGEDVTWNLEADISVNNQGNTCCFSISGDLYINDQISSLFSRTVDICLGSAGNYTISFGQITFTCGDKLDLKDVMIAWGTNANSCNSLPAFCPPGGQCGQEDSIGIKTPVGSETYQIPADCTNGMGTVGVTARGGIPGYTYHWENAVAQTVSSNNEFTASPGAYYVTVTDADNCEVVDSIMLEVTPDLTKPSLNCPASINVSNDPGDCGAFVDFAVVATDNCPGVTVSYSPQPNTFFQVGQTEITVIATDASDNKDTCYFDVIVTDNEINAQCQSISVSLDANGMANITASDIDDGTTDNCGISSMTVSPNSFDCTDVGLNQVIFTVTDVNMNTESCTTFVDVVDDIAPIANCVPSFTIDLTAAGTATITASQIDNGSTDNCGPVSLSIEPSSFSCANIGANPVVLSVTDGANLTSTCTTTVTVRDLTPPTALCQNIIVPLTTIGTASIVPNDVDNGSSDACAILSRTLSRTQFTCADVGQNQVTLTIVDVNGNSSNCNAIVAIIDDVDPTALCRNLTVELDANGSASITAADIDNGSFDNCGIADIQIDPASFSCSDLGNNIVTLTVTDVNDNSSSCNATVTVVDLISPSVTCVNDMTVNNDPGQCYATVNYSANYVENCTATMVFDPPSGSTFNINTSTTVTCTVTDQSGNTDICTFTVSVNDQLEPVISCPADITINCEDPTDPTFTGSATSSDPCGGANGVVTYTDRVTPGSCPNSYSITRTWTATDAADNSQSCDQIITVVDTQAPSITCPAQINVSCETDVPAPDPSSLIANDNCSSPGNIIVSHVSDVAVGTNPIYITRTYRAVDECQNANTCTQLIVVQNLVAPTLTCPAPVSVQCLADVPDPNINDVIAQANCGGTVTVTHLSDVVIGSCPTTIIRTYRGTDESGNITDCNQTITVSDTLAPQIANCPSGIDFGCFTNAEPSIANLPAPIIDPLVLGANDNCTPSNQLIVSYADYGPQINGCVYLFERIYTVTDACGNSTNCLPVQYSFTFDTEPPIFSNLPEDQVYDCGAPVPAVPNAPTVYDDCGGSITITFSETVSSASCLGEAYIRTWVATDACGNSSSYSQVASKQDLTPPEILRPADTIIHCGEAIPPVEYEIIESCKESRYEEEFHEEIIPGDCACSYTIMRIWSVYNNCLIEARDTQYIHVVDQTGPTITIINPMLEGLENGGTMKMYGCAEPDAVMTDIIADDCCGVADIITYDSLLAYKSCEAFDYFALWVCGYEATDPCGNKTIFRFYVQQIDTNAPAFITPDSFDYRIDLACNDPIPGVDTITILDDCDLIAELSYRADTVGFYPDSFAIIRSWEANDACLNTAILSQTITVCSFEPDSFVGEIGNLVWLDLNENGIQEPLEPGLNGVTIELHGDRDNDLSPDNEAEQIVLSKTRNGKDGQYYFTNLEPGRYFVRAVMSPTQDIADMHVGSDDSMDSDVDPATGFSYAVEVRPGQKNLDIDIGITQHADLQEEEQELEEEEDQEETANNLNSFYIEKEGCNNILHWGIYNSLGPNTFEVHRSFDGQIFEEIGTVQSSSSLTSFSYEDKNVGKTLYYRLLYLHSDGTVEVSKDIYVENNCHSVMNFVLFPNPTTNHFSISYEDNSNHELEGQILDVYGRVIRSWKIGKKYKGEKDNIHIDVVDGLYWIRVWDGVNQNIKPMMIIQNQR